LEYQSLSLALSPSAIIPGSGRQQPSFIQYLFIASGSLDSFYRLRYILFIEALNMDNNEYKNSDDKIKGLIFELDEFIVKLRAQMDILKQADMELDNASDQLDAELGFWDTTSKKIAIIN
jgi:hypothetical protein